MVLLLACSLGGFAQTRTVKGVVKDAQGVEIIGATVSVKGTKYAAVTDLNGEYTIHVPADTKQLTINYVGFEPQTVDLTNATTYTVTMQEASTMLNEVVAIGYAKVKRKDLTGASVSVTGSDLASVPATNAAQALAGKAAGVSIVSQNGAPGASLNITVRGGTSITQSTSPLYIIDGFQSDNGLSNVDVNDIETIDILKDASATAIYGARGSNGVVLITTKSAKKGKTTVSYNGYVQMDRLGKKLDLLNVEDYVKYQYEWWTLKGEMNQYARMFEGGYADIAATYGNQKGIDWQDEMFGGTATELNNNVAISTSGEKSRTYISYNNIYQNGLLENTGFTRNAIRAKYNADLFQHVRFDMSTSFQINKTQGGGSFTNLKQAIGRPETGGILFTDDQLRNEELNTDFRTFANEYDLYNPLIVQSAVKDIDRSRIFNINAGIEFDLFRDFTFRTAGSYTWRQIKSTMFDDGRTSTGIIKGGPYGSINNNEHQEYQWTNTLSWSHNYAKFHQLNALVGHEVWYSQTTYANNAYKLFPKTNFGLNDISMSVPDTWSSSFGENGIVSLFGRVNYAYADRYLLTATMRADGSSKFSKGNKWGYFPSVAAAWRISEENFFKKSALSSFVNSLKLRVGYGATGNCNISDYMYTTSYESTVYPIGNTETAALAPGSTVGNPNLKWETTKSTNIGLDLVMFNNRLNVTLDWYNNKSDDLLMNVKIPSSTGYTSQYQNIGAIRNRGLEVVVNSVNVENKNFRWTTDFNISFNRSRVLRIDGENEYYETSVRGGSNSNVVYRAIVGHALGEMFGYKTDGVYTTDDFVQNDNGTYSLKPGVIYQKGQKTANIKPGDVKFVSTAGQTDADGNPVYNADDRTVIGNAAPDFTGGLNNTFTYKNFDLSVFATFSVGNDLYNMSMQRYLGPWQPCQNLLAAVADRFTLVDPQTGLEAKSLSRLAELNPNQYSKDIIWSNHDENSSIMTIPVDRFVEDGSYLRISTITLGYTLPKAWLSKIRVSNLRLYCTLSNMFTITNYSGYDPEVSKTSSILTPGIDDSTYPRAKSVVFGINLSI
ncbi:MAG: TonB-dependent receptor [Prevotella sp.]|nr:TonB-dependent receptor [Prevotella sp.]